MRQKGDNESCETLNNMSKGCMDSDDIKLINSRECSLSQAPSKEAIRPCGTREECDYHNSSYATLLDFFLSNGDCSTNSRMLVILMTLES
jgi:hypothetical protein